MLRNTLTKVAAITAIAAISTTGCSNSADAPASSAGTTSASGAAGAGGKITIGYITKRGTDSFASDQVAAAKAAAAQVDVTLQTADVKQDSGLTISTVNQMLSSGVQGIIIVVPDQTLGPQILTLAKAKNVPVLASDDPIKDATGAAAPFIGLDGPALGKQAGTQLATLLAKAPAATAQNSALAVLSQNSVSACTERTKPAVDTFTAAAGGKATILDVPHDGTLQTAVTAMSATITQHPGIKKWYITSCNDDGVAGALRALESKGVTAANSFGVGMDGSLACTELAKSNGFVGANYVSFKDNGRIAFESMYKHLKDGTALPASQAVPGPFITRDNKSKIAGC